MKHMIASITTKYSGPTGSTGSRINATLHLARDGSTVRVRVSWNHGLGIEANHKQAAFAALGKAGLIRGDYDLDGWSHDGVGHWTAITPAHVPTIAGADDLRLVIEDLACYALAGWEEEWEDDRPEELALWKARVDAALKATGSKYTFDELKPLLG
jgi:hypothetical protein